MYSTDDTGSPQRQKIVTCRADILNVTTAIAQIMAVRATATGCGVSSTESMSTATIIITCCARAYIQTQEIFSEYYCLHMYVKTIPSSGSGVGAGNKIKISNYGAALI